MRLSLKNTLAERLEIMLVDIPLMDLVATVAGSQVFFSVDI